MKKILKRSIIISSIISILCALINFICANYFDVLPIGKTYAGGEIIEKIGYGIVFGEIFPMTFKGENVISTNYILDINIYNFFLCFAMTFVACFIILLIVDFLRKKVFINKKK